MSTGLATSIASKALDGLFMRQLAISNNIANAGNPTFKPVRVDFEASLKAAAARSDAAARVEQLVPSLHTASLPLQTTSRLDLEAMDSNETSMRYTMLLGMLDRHLQMRQLAVTDGRGA